jgi:bifunctional N-acetylglucosamine-1-phosphate-uridyltransferase/glucosamine-1-phosphate-acetyltransferase GlmU-like protein
MRLFIKLDNTFKEVSKDELKLISLAKGIIIGTNFVYTGNVYISDVVNIGNDVELQGDIFIGQNTVIGNGSTIACAYNGNNVVIGTTCEVYAHCVRDNSKIATGSYIGFDIII